uniref:ATP synthase subunit a n=1 Tax=Dolichoris vasculosae TaxID=130022 RepID=A0A8A2FCY5_9HYME|nr:ATP synthase F0 subunit 6 [Dolichoris vasculosae]
MIMMSIFSMFDPSTSNNFSMNWMAIVLMLFLIPKNYWMIPNRWNMVLIIIFQSMISEFKILLKKKDHYFNMILFMGLFLMILLNNYFGLMSYIFVPSSHMVFGLTLSLSIWLGINMYGWYKYYNHMFAHLVPSGISSMMLMMFLVVVETISNLMRFGSLALRLSANMIAGHVVLMLISTLMEFSYSLAMIAGMIQILLIILELMVSFIQAYVFTMLVISYTSEIP